MIVAAKGGPLMCVAAILCRTKTFGCAGKNWLKTVRSETILRWWLRYDAPWRIMCSPDRVYYAPHPIRGIAGYPKDILRAADPADQLR